MRQQNGVAGPAYQLVQTRSNFRGSQTTSLERPVHRPAHCRGRSINTNRTMYNVRDVTAVCGLHAVDYIALPAGSLPPTESMPCTADISCCWVWRLGFLYQFSMSSIVCGRGRFSVSGKKKVSMPLPTARPPNSKPGSHGTMRVCVNIKKQDKTKWLPALVYVLENWNATRWIKTARNHYILWSLGS